MQVEVKSTNGKGIASLFKRLEKGHVNVGVLKKAGKHEGSDLTVAQVGLYNEFGTATIPERSFIRSTIEEKSREIKKVSQTQYKKVLNGDIDLNKGLGILGVFVQGLIQEKFTNNNWLPNVPSTIISKGSSKPLINTGQLRQSISFEVEVK
jgi:hypothetical protein